ncbi:uncharacterized protein LOC123875305 [Maniola jurtina]|uniref:uncharacterized protein LOC123875305 n=1 Tax=Maniola jurtina TaxID=191418 RepID=UPI001E68AE16|nr:uncharacterized protein LOC123875305 [Maniola jurtina]
MCVYKIYVFPTLLESAKSDLSVLTPEIICSEGDNNTLGRPDYSMIRILSESHTDMHIKWSVRWSPLTVTTQRFTIITWKSVRDLEKKLNGPQLEPLLFVLKNDELISGVNYILNLTAIVSDEIITKSFSIKYYKYNQDATESTNDAFSMMLLGGRTTCADVDFAIEADVRTCSSTQDYYFSWEVYSTTSAYYVNVSNIIGSNLEMPRYTLKPGFYDVNCQLRNESNDILLKEVKVPIHVHSCGLDVFLSVDHLVISTDNAFTIESVVINHDYEDYPVQYDWKCLNNLGESCDFIDNSHDNSFNFSSGIPKIGEYLITLIVVASNQSANASATIDVMEPNLPILQIEPVNRVINQGSSTTLLGKAFHVAPSCSVTWYFAAEGFLNTSELHGVAISDTHTVFSLEESFLSELADFSNDTTSVEIEVDITSAGRARFLVECNCTYSANCESIDLTATYAELYFQLNETPKVEDLMVSPETGSALETLFQIRSRAKDFDRPLRYSFYCAIGPNVTLLLGSYLEYDTVETFLPFIGRWCNFNLGRGMRCAWCLLEKRNEQHSSATKQRKNV